MARIFLILTILSVLASGYFAYVTVGKGRYWKDQDAGHVATLTTTKAKLDETAKALETTKSSLDDQTTKLNEATAKNSALQGDLTKSQSTASDLQKKIDDLKQQVTSAQADLKTAKDNAGTQSEAAQAAQAKVTQLQADLKIQNDKLDQAQKETDRLNDLIERQKKGGIMPPGVNGKVVSINTNWNFVVLNIGENQGVVANGELIIYRNKDYVGKVRVANTERNTCVADILVESLKGTVQVGDDAMN